MTPNGEPIIPDPIRSLMQTQHPGIAGEIEGAITTLRKLQKIAGPPEAARPPGAGVAEPSADATTDGAPAAGGAAGVPPAEIAA
ncbi:MAG TPA: hypothetical protein DDY78_22995, partial [Planctomycetales bacterium]|nr:hypothetical protein [Planctomycetales bacterium]